MRVQKRSPWLAGLAMGLAGLALFAGRSTADVTSDRGGSIVIFPKVIADSNRDTLITLSNTSNMPLMAHCAYVQGTGRCERTPEQLCQSNLDCEELDGGQPNVCIVSWAKSDFDLFLTMKQPTMWRVSTGRKFDPTASFSREYPPEARAKCKDAEDGKQTCPGFFFVNEEEFEGRGDGGFVPPPIGSPEFRGELKCAQVHPADGSLVPGDWLKGEATILTLGSNQISRYNSINIQGAAESENAFVARLNQDEYNACPEAWEVTHFATNTSNFVAEGLGVACEDGVSDGPGSCDVRTELTMIPCSQDLVGDVTEGPERVAVQFEIFDEFENRTTAGLPFECWSNVSLDDTINGFYGDGTTLKKTRVYTPQNTVCRAGANRGAVCANDAACGAGGVCGPQSGIIVLAEQFYNSGTIEMIPATAATNAHMVNLDDDDDIARAGRCRGDLSKTCTTSAQCGAGLCRLNTTQACQNDADCGTLNSQCLGNDDLDPPCCSGAGAGTCETDDTQIQEGDICDRCMNDEIFIAQP